ncbi:MAG: hypothetical protein ACRD50_13935 [Candidatus Acidiferrales bacterium]
MTALLEEREKFSANFVTGHIALGNTANSSHRLSQSARGDAKFGCFDGALSARKVEKLTSCFVSIRLLDCPLFSRSCEISVLVCVAGRIGADFGGLEGLSGVLGFAVTVLIIEGLLLKRLHHVIDKL